MEESGGTAQPVRDDAGSPVQPTWRAWLAAAVIGVAVSLVAQLFLAFVDAGPVVSAGVGILSGIFIAGRRLRVHGVGPWIGVALAVITLQVVVGLFVLVALGSY